MTALANKTVVPVILTGGSGSRLWPLSREQTPKQFLPLLDSRSLLQQTIDRVRGQARFAAPIVVANEQHRFVVAEQMRALDVAPAEILLEPVGRNTAPAVAVAALVALARDPGALLMVLPSDHVVRDQAAFTEAVEAAVWAAMGGRLVTFGIRPTSPHEGYGYIRAGSAVDGDERVRHVAQFIEKPPRDTAERLIAVGDCLWNSGMFLFSAQAYIDALQRHAPDVLPPCRDAVQRGQRDLDFFRLDAKAFAASPAISVDHAVMERSDQVATVPVDMRWSDAGAWSEIWVLSDKDDKGNATAGDVALRDSGNCLVRSDGPLVGCVGVDDLVVVATDDAVLVAHRDRTQDVKGLVDDLRRRNSRQATEHRKVYRPWGAYETLHLGQRFQVKSIVVKPGGKLSAQKHFHRAEHWVVVSGTAMVTRGDEQVLLRENESIFIPLGSMHRLENPGKIPLCLIEVQSGAYLGEDDIVRYDDCYGRS